MEFDSLPVITSVTGSSNATSNVSTSFFYLLSWRLEAGGWRSHSPGLRILVPAPSLTKPPGKP